MCIFILNTFLMFYVYIHTRLDTNEIFYIGISSDKNYKRAYSFKDRNPIWKKIVKKTTFIVDVIYDNLTKKQAFKKEIQLIRKYGRLCLGNGKLANISEGGESCSGRIMPKQERIKRGLSRNKILTEEKVLKICKLLISGKTFNDIIKIYRNLKPHHLHKIKNKKCFLHITEHFDFSNVKKSKWYLSEKTKKKMSKSKKGNRFYKKRKPRGVSIKCIEDDIEFLSIKDASIYYKCNYTSIANNLIGISKKLRINKSFAYV